MEAGLGLALMALSTLILIFLKLYYLKIKSELVSSNALSILNLTGFTVWECILFLNAVG